MGAGRALKVGAIAISMAIVAGCGGNTGTGAATSPTASAAVTTATPTPAPIKVRAAYGNVTPANLAPFYAKEKGIFLENGLDVDLSLIDGGGKSMAALLGNSVDIAQLGGTELMSAYIGGGHDSHTDAGADQGPRRVRQRDSREPRAVLREGEGHLPRERP